MKILVTGGTGYIGSHTCVELIASGHEVVILDNLYNSSIDVLDKIETISGVRPVFYKVDILDKEGMEKVFKENTFDAVIHFAGDYGPTINGREFCIRRCLCCIQADLYDLH